MKRKLQALFVILVLGVLKFPVEESATRYLREVRLLSPPLDMSVRDSIGQMGVAASLGGLRSLVASIIYLQAYTAWSNVDWPKVDSLFQLATSLQPRYENYWDEAAWQMAYNAASNYRNNQRINPALREKLYQDHVERGVEILKQALKALPDSARLWNTLAEVYGRRLEEPEKAAECYLEVFRLIKDARFERFAAYQYAQTQKRELWQKAYDMLRTSYDAKQRPPTLINTMKQLENQLNIPEAKRIPEVVTATEPQHGKTGAKP